MGLTADLCARIAAARYEDMPPEALAAGRRLVLDGLAVAVATGDRLRLQNRSGARRGAERVGDACPGF